MSPSLHSIASAAVGRRGPRRFTTNMNRWFTWARPGRAGIVMSSRGAPRVDFLPPPWARSLAATLAAARWP